MMPFPGGRGGRGGMHPQYQMMALMAAQRQAAEKQRSKEDLAGRFKELLLDKGVSGPRLERGEHGVRVFKDGCHSTPFLPPSSPPRLPAGDCIQPVGEGAAQAAGRPALQGGGHSEGAARPV